MITLAHPRSSFIWRLNRFSLALLWPVLIASGGSVEAQEPIYSADIEGVEVMIDESSGEKLWAEEHPAERAAAESIGGSYFYFATVPGSGNATSSSMVHTFSGATACTTLEGGLRPAGGFDLAIHLPDDHTVTFFRAYFRDNDADVDGAAFLLRADFPMPLITTGGVQTSGQPGFGSVGTAVNHTVTNSGSALLARFRHLTQEAGDLSVCAIRLAVSPPTEGIDP